MTTKAQLLDTVYKNWVTTTDPGIKTFCANLYGALQPPVMAMDAALKGETTMPSNNTGYMLNGMSKNGYDQWRPSRTIKSTTTDTHYAGGRDQLWERSENGEGQQQASQDQETNGAPIDANMCLLFIQKLLNGLQSQDAANETDEHNKLMQSLGEMLQAAHNNNGNGSCNGSAFNGRGSMDRARRSARDKCTTFPSAGSPQDLNKRTSMDRRIAQDATVRAINEQAFYQRFPEMRRIKLSANGRY
jgi:hypothetical protein